MKSFKRGGIHPNPSKLSSEQPLAWVTPSEGELLTVLLTQSIGAPARVCVKPGDNVMPGTLIAEAGGFVSANVHAPVEGTVKRIEPARDAQGLWRPAVIIAPAENAYAAHNEVRDVADGGMIPPAAETGDAKELSRQEIIDITARAGIVGMGGATFPTHVKLNVPPGKSIDTLLINGAECEPYLTCDDRLMREYPAEIVDGANLLRTAVGAARVIIGIEANKPEAITAMRQAAKRYPEMSVVALKARYPQGGEKQLIWALTGRTVPCGALPADVGTVVDNVATAYALHRAARHEEPLYYRAVTVTGPEVARPGNYLVYVGTPISTLLRAAGVDMENVGKVIAGGPMMGRAISNLDAPTTKGLSGLLVMPPAAAHRAEVMPCVRCARCVQACPMGLEPYLLMSYGEHGMDAEADASGVKNCLECGSCNYTCPSARPILDYIRLSRQRLRKG